MDIRETICDFKNLYNALQICKRNTQWKDSVAGHLNNSLINIYKLKERLDNDKYKISPYSEFIIYEPKERHIQSTRIADRVFQRSLCDNYVSKEITKGFIYDNCACLKGKGTEFARRRLKRHLQVHFRKYGLTGGVLKCDLKNYFGSTLHSVAKEAIEKRVANKWVVGELFRIVDSFGHGEPIGIGLGSQVSQLIQLAVMDDIDHYIKEKLHIKTYVRYMDDFILIHPDKEYLKECKKKIREMVEAIGLTLNKKKSQVNDITQPIHFLGFSYKLTATGKVVVRVLPAKISHERRKLKKQVERVKAGIMTKEQVDDCYKSFKAHVSGRRYGKNRRKRRPVMRRNTHNAILKMDKFYKKLWENIDMKHISKDEQLKRALRENKAIKADVKEQAAKSDYIAMMAGIDVDKGENKNDGE